MASLLRFHPFVADDLKDATKWYDDISGALGNRFRRAINSSLDAVEERPEWFGRVRGDRRAARVKGFPYLIIFEIEKEAIEVVGVFHAAADPEQWSREKRA